MDVFSKMAPGTTFRFQAQSVIPGKINWIHGRFERIEGKKVMWTYWDYRHSHIVEWDRHDYTDTIEPWDPSLKAEDLASPVYLETISGEYVLSPWTLGELAGSSWINHYTHDLVHEAVVDYDRFGSAQLYYSVRDGFTSYWTLTTYHDIRTPRVWDDLVICHWARYDIMTPEEQIERARQRVAYCVQETRSTRYNGRPPPSAERDLEKAKRLLQFLSGATLITPDILNAGSKAGDQLSLF
jgi:hypothetical protein